MTEWYVISEGFGVTFTPKAVVLGRLAALSKLTDGFRVTKDETKKLGLFMEAGLCDLYTGLHLVGYEDSKGYKHPDRKLVRVVGPGTEV